MVAELGEWRVEGLPPFWIPFRAIDIDVAARAFNVEEIDGVRGKNSDVDLEHLGPLAHLEVVEDQPIIRQMISEEADRLALGIICGLADGEDLGHQLPPASIACSTSSRALSSSSTARARSSQAFSATSLISRRRDSAGQ